MRTSSILAAFDAFFCVSSSYHKIYHRKECSSATLFLHNFKAFRFRFLFSRCCLSSRKPATISSSARRGLLAAKSSSRETNSSGVTSLGTKLLSQRLSSLIKFSKISRGSADKPLLEISKNIIFWRNFV